MKKTAPIALFTYNRLWHTRQTVDALRKNELADESDLIIFSDGPKDEISKVKVEEVRTYLKTIIGFKSIKIIESGSNLGLAKSIIDGVTKVVNEYGRIIVVEDDLITSPYFLRFINDGLNFYENREDVISICGYMYPLKQKLPETFFLKFIDSWGWGTWKHAWKLFEPDGQKLLNALVEQNLTNEFDILGTSPFTDMIKGQIAGKNNSWAVRWYASAFLKRKLSLFPGKSLVHNIGNDKTGAHCGRTFLFDVNISKKPIKVNNDILRNDEGVLLLLSNFFKVGMYLKISDRIRSFLKDSYLVDLCLKRFKMCFGGKIILSNWSKTVKKLLKELLPPIMVKTIKKFLEPEYGFLGNFKNWDDARKLSIGYDSEKILDKVRDSLIKVRDGKAVYERDSVLFDRIEYSWPLLAGLMKATAESGNKLSVLDFGGSLGSTYFQNRKFLSGISELKWNIVEQKKIVEYGRKYFENGTLKFFFDVEECFAANPDVNVVIMSSVIHYIEKPYELLRDLIEKRVKYFIVDRTPLIREKEEKIVVQKINPEIVDGCYPAWLLNKDKFIGKFLERYDMVEEFDSFETININCEFKGYIFKLK